MNKTYLYPSTVTEKTHKEKDIPGVCHVKKEGVESGSGEARFFGGLGASGNHSPSGYYFSFDT